MQIEPRFRSTPTYSVRKRTRVLPLAALTACLIFCGLSAARPAVAEDVFERFQLSDQSGQTVRFTDLVESRRVALQLIFTSCGTICPTMGAQFGHLQKVLASQAMDDVHLISVSIDPARDTPQRLKSWAGRFGHDPKRWTLLTGPAPQINDLQEQLGVGVGDKNRHPALVLVNDGHGGKWLPVDALGGPDAIVAALDRLRDESPAEVRP